MKTKASFNLVSFQNFKIFGHFRFFQTPTYQFRTSVQVDLKNTIRGPQLKIPRSMFPKRIKTIFCENIFEIANKYFEIAKKIRNCKKKFFSNFSNFESF